MKKYFVFLLFSISCTQANNTSTNNATNIKDTSKPYSVVVHQDSSVNVATPVHQAMPVKSIDTRTANQKMILSAGPMAIVYKTKSDYYDKVPVTLNGDKTKIVSYPAPSDIYYNGKLSFPTRLSKGYLLDNRGINVNVAFLNITYKQYSKLAQAPPVSELMNDVVDKDPLTEMYNAGSLSRYKNMPADLNKMIDSVGVKYFVKLR